MINKLFYVVLCFLIFSCDLPNEEDRDCNGDQSGTAFIDDCGYCAGGDTDKIPNSDKDLCGECFGTNSCLNGLCGDDEAINYNTCAFSEDEIELCNDSGDSDCYVETGKVCSDITIDFNYSFEDFSNHKKHIDDCHDIRGCKWDFDSHQCENCQYISKINNELCVNNLCEDYLPSDNDAINCDSTLSDEDYSYSVGEQIRCDLDDLIGNVCYPGECENNFSFSDLYGKIIWIEISATW